jgi:hypothetical protein
MADGQKMDSIRVLSIACLFTRRLVWAQKIAKRQPVDVLYCGKQSDAVPIASIASGTAMWISPGAVEHPAK